MNDLVTAQNAALFAHFGEFRSFGDLVIFLINVEMRDLGLGGTEPLYLLTT